MNVWQQTLQQITDDPLYQENLDWGEVRAGHPEGTLRAHIAELERNLHRLRHQLTPEEQDQLRLLIHVHDLCKPNAKRGVPILDSRSHASLAREYLARFCSEEPLLSIVQFHDEPFALYQQYRHRGSCSTSRFEDLLAAITTWDLFLPFLIIDGCTVGKSREPLQWFFEQIDGQIVTRWTAQDLLL